MSDLDDLIKSIPLADIAAQLGVSEDVASEAVNQTVPTLVYADGTAQTNPSLAQVKAKIEALSA